MNFTDIVRARSHNLSILNIGFATSNQTIIKYILSFLLKNAIHLKSLHTLYLTFAFTLILIMCRSFLLYLCFYHVHRFRQIRLKHFFLVSFRFHLFQYWNNLVIDSIVKSSSIPSWNFEHKNVSKMTLVTIAY